MKFCAKCKCELPATTEFFFRDNSRPDGLYHSCKDCESARKSEWYRNNTEEAKKKRQKWRGNNKDKISDYGRKWNKDNNEKQRKNTQRWYHKNKKRRRELDRQWKERNPERAALISRTGSHNRRAKLRLAEGTHTAEDILLQYEQQEGRCYYCENELDGVYHVDHVIPLSKDGSNDPTNLVCACPACNLSKNDRTPEEWYAVVDNPLIRAHLLDITSIYSSLSENQAVYKKPDSCRGRGLRR